METISAILEPDVDGTVHVPVPMELRGAKVRVIATMQNVANDVADLPRLQTRIRRKSNGPEMARAMEMLAACGGVTSITDAVEWQRELRKDRPLSGRE